MNKIKIFPAATSVILTIAILTACAPATPAPAGGSPATNSAATREQSTGPVVPSSENTSTETPPANKATTPYGAAEIAAHNSPADCWVAANGQVYDITNFLAKHKSPLNAFCGQTAEFEEAYTAQHGNSKEDVLGAYQIGVLQ